MSNRFVVSQPITLRPTETQRLQETQAREQQRSRAEQSLRSSPNSPVIRVINRVMDFAAKGGTLTENLFEELEEYDFLIRLMLVDLTEDEVAEVIHQFRFVNSIPWPFTRDLLISATKAGRQPLIDMKDAIEFALKHYSNKRNINLTLELVDETARLQPLIPELRLFPMLLDSLTGGGIEDLSVMQLSENNIEQFETIQSLLSLAFAKPEGNMEQIRIDFKKNRDKLENLRRIDDRYKAIQDALLTDEFNRAMSRVVQLLTKTFELSQNDPKILTVRRIMMLLQMGQEARKQFFSPLESTTISDPQRPGQQQKSPRKILSNENYKSVKVAQVNPGSANTQNTTQPVPIAMSDQNKIQLKNYINALILTIDRSNKLFSMSEEEFSRFFPKEPQALDNFKKFKSSPIVQKQIASLINLKPEFVTLIQILDSPNILIDAFNSKFFEVLNKYNDVKYMV